MEPITKTINGKIHVFYNMQLYAICDDSKKATLMIKHLAAERWNPKFIIKRSPQFLDKHLGKPEENHLKDGKIVTREKILDKYRSTKSKSGYLYVYDNNEPNPFKITRTINKKPINFGVFEDITAVEDRLIELDNNDWDLSLRNSRPLSSTGEEYIYFDANTGKAIVRKNIDGKLKQFGSFDTVDEAVPLRNELRANNWKKAEILETPTVKETKKPLIDKTSEALNFLTEEGVTANMIDEKIQTAFEDFEKKQLEKERAEAVEPVIDKTPKPSIFMKIKNFFNKGEA